MILSNCQVDEKLNKTQTHWIQLNLITPIALFNHPLILMLNLQMFVFCESPEILPPQSISQLVCISHCNSNSSRMRKLQHSQSTVCLRFRLLNKYLSPNYLLTRRYFHRPWQSLSHNWDWSSLLFHDASYKERVWANDWNLCQSHKTAFKEFSSWQ